MKLSLLVPLVLSLAACGERPPEPAVVTTPPAGSDQPAADVPPATTRASYSTDCVVARFGSNEEQVRMAWGADLGDARPAESGGCYQLMPQPRGTSGYRIAFMLEGGKFARIDVDATDIEAPGGGKVGMSAQEIGRRYGTKSQVRRRRPLPAHPRSRCGRWRAAVRDRCGWPGHVLAHRGAAAGRLRRGLLLNVMP